MPEPKRNKRRFKRKTLTVFVMDAPNVDASLGDTLGRAPLPSERMRMDVLMQWLRNKQQANRSQLYAKIFVNRPTHPTARNKQFGWIAAMQKLGYHVYSKVRTADDSDIDEEMVEYIGKLVGCHNVVEIILASNDGWRFNSLMEVLAISGIKVTILGFEEYPSVLTKNELFSFVPYSAITGLCPTVVSRKDE